MTSSGMLRRVAPHDVTSQRTAFFIVTVVKTSNPTNNILSNFIYLVMFSCTPRCLRVPTGVHVPHAEDHCHTLCSIHSQAICPSRLSTILILLRVYSQGHPPVNLRCVGFLQRPTRLQARFIKQSTCKLVSDLWYPVGLSNGQLVKCFIHNTGTGRWFAPLRDRTGS
jgi:hypothetical protein